MIQLFSKNHLLALLALLSVNTISSSLTADDCCYSPKCNRFYIGAFGGENYSNKTRLSQQGTAFFFEEFGGALAVYAQGNARKTSTGFGGAQIGYELLQNPWNLGCSDWNITPAAEIEAFFYSHTKKGDLINPTDRLDEHDFRNSFPMDVGVYLVNGIFSINSCCLGSFTPYIGGGIGAANLSIHKAKSFQIDPPEPGVNHFNSKRHDSDWAFAAQAKTGVRFNFCERFHIFAEYRFLFVDSSSYIFGSTVSPGHAVTSPWNVDVKNMYYNSFAVGIQFDL